MNEVLKSQWGRKKSYVMMWRQYGNSHFLVTVSAGGGCEAAVTARTKCELV